MKFTVYAPKYGPEFSPITRTFVACVTGLAPVGTIDANDAEEAVVIAKRKGFLAPIVGPFEKKY